MKSKALEYIVSLGKKPEELPEKYRENLEVMQEFAEIYSLVEPDSEEAKEAKAEYEDYDEKILQALKRDYPLSTPKDKKPTASTAEEKIQKEFVSWVVGKIKGAGGEVDHQYLTDKWNRDAKEGIGVLRILSDINDIFIAHFPEGPQEANQLFYDEYRRLEAKYSGAKPKKKQAIMSMPPVDENGQRRIDKAALDALEAHLEALPQTKAMHTTPTGKYTAERQALHTEIISKELSDNTCIRREAPIAILTGGLPGSGKSTFIRKNRDWMTNPAIFKVDADEVRAKLPEYQGWNAPQTHQESRDIVNRLIEKIGAHGCSFDVIYDGTMNKSEKYGPLIQKLKEEGYQVFVLYMKVDKATSMKRAMGRYQKSGRYVPRFVIEEAAENGLAAFDDIKNMVDGYVLVDGVTQKVLEKGGKEIPKDRDYSALSEEKPDTANTPAPNRVTDYNWKDKADIKQLSPIVIHCQHYHLEAKEEMEVGLKGKGNATRKVPVKPSEHLIFDDKGYLVFVMDAESFERKCIEQVTVEEHEAKKHAGSDKVDKEAEKPKPAPVIEEKPEPAAKEKEKPKAAEEGEAREAPKPAAKPEVKPKPVSKPRKKPKPAAKNKPAPKPQAASEPQAGSPPTIAAIEKEIDDIRIAQGKKPLDKDLFRKEYQDLAEKKDNKSYLAYIRKQLKQAQDEGLEFSEQEIIKLGIAIRPLIQRPGSALLDILLTSKKVLAPTYDNLIRWTESPGRYDLQGVDVSVKAKESVKARKVEEPSLFEMIGL